MADLSAPIQVLHVPNDVELLAAIGRVVICHGHLNHVLIRTIKTFAQMEIQEADYSMAKTPMPVLRQRIERLSTEKLGAETEAYKTLMSLLTECEKVTDLRNKLVHCLWVSDWEHSDLVLKCRDGDAPVPSAAQINQTAAVIQELTRNINEGRLSGFIAEAIASRGAESASGNPQ